MICRKYKNTQNQQDQCPRVFFVRHKCDFTHEFLGMILNSTKLLKTNQKRLLSIANSSNDYLSFSQPWTRPLYNRYVFLSNIATSKLNNEKRIMSGKSLQRGTLGKDFQIFSIYKVNRIRFHLQSSSTWVVNQADLFSGRSWWRLRGVPGHVVGSLHQQDPRHHVDEDLPGPRRHAMSRGGSEKN